jgi:hypothetical protein
MMTSSTRPVAHTASGHLWPDAFIFAEETIPPTAIFYALD